MSDRSISLDDTLRRYLLDSSLREHPAQTALREDQRVDLSMLPIGDGLTLARKR